MKTKIILIICLFVLSTGFVPMKRTFADNTRMFVLRVPLTNGDIAIMGGPQVSSIVGNNSETVVGKLSSINAISSQNRFSISNDGKWMIIFYDSAVPALFGRTDGSSPFKTIPNRFIAGFSSDSRYVLYYNYGGSAASQQIDYLVGVYDLTSGTTLELTSNLNNNSVPGGGNAAVYPLDVQGNILYGTTYGIATDGGFSGLYRFVLGKFAVVNGSYALPNGVAVAPVKFLQQTPLISPNGKYAAILYPDPSNPPKNYAPSPYTPENTLNVIDLNSGQMRTIAVAGSGEILTNLRWRETSDALTFTGGLIKPGVQGLTTAVSRFFSVNVSTGQVSALYEVANGVFTQTPFVCGDNMYRPVAVDTDAELRIYQSPLSNPGVNNDVGKQAGTILLGCVK